MDFTKAYAANLPLVAQIARKLNERDRALLFTFASRMYRDGEMAGADRVHQIINEATAA